MYAPFVSDGFVSLDGKERKPVKILQDTRTNESHFGGDFEFFIHTATAGKSPVLGIGLVPLWVACHRFTSSLILCVE